MRTLILTIILLSRNYTPTKNVLQTVLLNYRNTLAKTNIAIQFVSFAKSFAIHIATPQKVSQSFIAAIFYHDINNPVCIYII